jgi:hypothetical protein
MSYADSGSASFKQLRFLLLIYIIDFGTSLFRFFFFKKKVVTNSNYDNYFLFVENLYDYYF